jgi:TolB-like protein/class 3 adenylate cyclase
MAIEEDGSPRTRRAIRRLAAILVADMVGYARLMGIDEEGTFGAFKRGRRELIDPKVEQYRGRIVKSTGDGVLAEFASAIHAVRCAVEVQTEMAEWNSGRASSERIEYRIGINVGDVILDEDDGDIHGDGVNLAVRLEGLADPGGICISRAARDQVRDRLGLVFEDMGDRQVKNIARPVRAYRVIFGEGASTSRPAVQSAPPASLPLPDKPSIAVLPFQNMSGDPEQEYFVDGMVEEIITALSRIRWLFVIARNSTFTYKGQAIDVKRVGREQGVRYVLEGAVRKSAGRVRITAQLIEAETAAHLWAERFDGSLEDVFELQDQVASRVAGVIEPALQAAETARSGRRPTNDLTAYDLYLRSYAIVFSSAAQIQEALHLVERAIERDPRYGPALSWAAFCCLRLLLDERSENREADRLKGAAFARRALEVAGDDPGTLANAAQALAFFGEDIGAMIALVDRALVLNPNYARGWHISGTLRMWAGQPDIAIQHAETSLRLSPLARVGTAVTTIGIAHFLSRRFDEAVAKLLVAIQEDPGYPQPYRYLAAAYAHMGRVDEAREVVGRLRALTPVVVPAASHMRNAEHRDLYLSGLRLAVGNEGAVTRDDAAAKSRQVMSDVHRPIH